MKKILSLIFILLFPILTSASTKNANPQISALFVDLTHSKILYAENSRQRLIPASVTKLFVAATALKELSSTYTFTTPVYARGQLKQGILNGDLVLYGKGDPMLINEKMWELVNTLDRLGLKEIHGNIVINNSYFGTVKINDPDRIKAKTNSAKGYNGLLSSAGSNFGTIGISIIPAEKETAPAIISLIPGILDNTILSGSVTTSNKKSKLLQLTRESKDSKEFLYISGSIPTQISPIVEYRSIGNPDQATGALLKYFLQRAGIIVTGKIRVESTPLQSHDKLLVEEQSHPLSQIIWAMLSYSNNFIADMVTLDLWRHNHQGTSSIALNQAATQLLNTYKEIKNHSVFTTKTNTLPTLDSGSGLTPTNQLSAEDIVILLEAIYKDERNFPVIYGGLVIPGQIPEWHHVKTITHPWMNRVSVKTGSLSDPVLVNSLAGYFRMKNGNMGAFAILLNQSGDNSVDLEKILISKLDAFFTKN